jgi:hypothetical protein
LEEPVVDGRIITKYIFEKWDGGMDWIYFRKRQVASCCEWGNEPSSSIK